MSDVGVEVDIRSIDKAMRDAGFSDFWIHFRTDNCTVDQLGEALNTANDPDGTFAGDGLGRTPTGIVFMVTDLGGRSRRLRGVDVAARFQPGEHGSHRETRRYQRG